jgi:hypothetical protein
MEFFWLPSECRSSHHERRSEYIIIQHVNLTARCKLVLTLLFIDMICPNNAESQSEIKRNV